MDTEEVNQLVHDTVKKLFDKEKKLKKPFPILVEEAHEWIPEQGRRGEDGEVTDMLIRVGKRGRKRGLGICALSQRPASVDKDYKCKLTSSAETGDLQSFVVEVEPATDPVSNLIAILGDVVGELVDSVFTLGNGLSSL